MKLPVIVLPEAKGEASETASWYESQQTGRGDAFLDALDDALQRLGEHPERYPCWRRDLPFRRLLLSLFPDLVFYEIRPDSIEVHAIAHTSRRPGYWLSRREG